MSKDVSLSTRHSEPAPRLHAPLVCVCVCVCVVPADDGADVLISDLVVGQERKDALDHLGDGGEVLHGACRKFFEE
jgi:hypothetical protein